MISKRKQKAINKWLHKPEIKRPEPKIKNARGTIDRPPKQRHVVYHMQSKHQERVAPSVNTGIVLPDLITPQTIDAPTLKDSNDDLMNPKG